MIRTLVTPRWLLGLLVAVLFAVSCVLLGRWQWGKYEGKLARNAVIAANYSATPVPLASVAGRVPLSASGEWTRVTATGTYESGRRLLVRNRVLDGSPGLEVLEPFDVSSSDGTPIRVLVDRGWVQNADTAAAEPVVPVAPAGTVTVQGWLRRPEVDLDKSLPDGQLASVSVSGAQRTLGGAPLLGAYVVLEAERAADGSTPVRPTPLAAPDTGLGVNQAYAIQWWLFAVFGFVFYGYRVRVLRADLAEARRGSADRAVGAEPTSVPGDLVGAGTGTARRSSRPKKVRIWDEEDA